MKLSEAIQNYEIYKIIQKVKNKKGKIKEYEIQLDDVNDGLDAEGKIGIRNVNDYTVVPIERLVFILNEVIEDDCNNEWLKKVVAGMKKCYQRLEAIDNAKPSEAITELDNIKNILLSIDFYSKVNLDDDIFESIENIKQALLEAQEVEKLLDHERELNNHLILKAQEQENVIRILFEKNVRIYWIKSYSCVKSYNNGLPKKEQLTEEEFNTLKGYTNEQI